MRLTVALGVLVLAGCGPYGPGPVQLEALRLYEERRAARPPAEIEAERQAMERNRTAEIICRERGNMAASQPAYGGPGLSGSIVAGFQQGMAAEQVTSACWRAYSATGVMPNY